MTNERLEAIGTRYDALVLELRTAAAHAEDCASHFRGGEIPRGCAHAFALEGHVRFVMRELEALSMDHATMSTPMHPPSERSI